MVRIDQGSVEIKPRMMQYAMEEIIQIRGITVVEVKALAKDKKKWRKFVHEDCQTHILHLRVYRALERDLNSPKSTVTH